ncbi:hypothetical protein, partial [Microlunatus aurantiacus]|uniref:hypothetical protein n=1 Tax=Microlunatus aurantiacus TaxID=446786 RepID=UPI0031E190A4
MSIDAASLECDSPDSIDHRVYHLVLVAWNGPGGAGAQLLSPPLGEIKTARCARRSCGPCPRSLRSLRS